MYAKLQKVVDDKLCSGCGTCVGVCPVKCLKISTEKPYPQKLNDKCTSCDLCHQACPGVSVDFPALTKTLQNLPRTPNKIPPQGHALKYFVAHSTDPTTRKNAASGGAITSLLTYLFDKKQIQSSILAGFEKGWIPKPYIAKSSKDLPPSRQSKYTYVPTNSLLQETKKPSAFVGVPCQVHGLRKLPKPTQDKFSIVIGTHCGFNSEWAATLFTLRKLKVNPRDIKKLEYRGGEWPGGFKVTLKSGKIKYIPKFEHNYTIPFFIPNRCLLCIDHTNVFADISVGDAWLPEYTKRGSGYSLVTARTQRGLTLLKKAESAGYIKLQEIPPARAQKAHAHTVKIKANALARMRIYKALGKPTPNYNLSTRTGAIKLFHELGFLIIIRTLSTKYARFKASLTPIKFIGSFISLVRKMIAG